jgi:hypothetical protein
MKLRRRIAFPKAQLRDLAWQLQQEFATTGMGSGVTLLGNNFKPLILSRSCPLWVKSRHQHMFA